ncbi:hypothetical protein M2323_002430 [Rhodoblastus acidophilus]|uniref:hypothetical protein n=1 Tax=Rhodoblastus acidophilus TaxID=1074 RepID=UPI002223F665|nr:hypothetical protein [Rhodoblastus acidophilus]MCW2284543.1 hypothetical protein [Rhodoblastus acidophilus]MCW2333496.1 hypothetical protein [Rhodoblastus acidophilus]
MKRNIWLAIFGFTPGLALAQEASGCGQFKWPVDRERTALAQARAMVETGGAVEVGTPVVAHLASVGAIRFDNPPERAPAEDSFGAILKLKPAAGVYTIALSAPGWIDVLQDGAPIKPAAFSGVRDCAGIRKILKYELDAKPTIVQLSNARDASVAIVILPSTR